jgi:hypothetical protein
MENPTALLQWVCGLMDLGIAGSSPVKHGAQCHLFSLTFSVEVFSKVDENLKHNEGKRNTSQKCIVYLAHGAPCVN